MSQVKTLARRYGWWRALSTRVRFALLRRLLGEEKALLSASERIAGLPGHTGVYARHAFYRAVLDHVGPDAYIGFMTVFSKRGARIGARAYIGRFCSIGLADIGENAMLADGVQVISGRHTHGGSKEAQAGADLHERPPSFERVTIGKGAWIAAGAVVMADVGEGAIVGAGAVVTRPIPDHVTAVGVPARPLPRA